MPIVNIDLEDGLPEISFPISEQNLDRFTAFMAKYNKTAKHLDKADELINALYESGQLMDDSLRKVQEYIHFEA